MFSRKRVFDTAVIGFLLGFLVNLGLGRLSETHAAPNYEHLDLFTKVLHFVQTNYVEEVEGKKLIEGAIKGMLATLDPHTVYLPADQFKEMQVDTSGKFGGLGIEITLTDGILTVVTPIEDTPAFYAGVEPGDRIIAIEDKIKKIRKETKGMTLQDAVSLMRGEKGSKVSIYVLRSGTDKIIPIEIRRDIIKVIAVKGGLLENNYAWVRITNFQTHTARDVRRKIESFMKENDKPLQGIVLDLRNNPGGLLEEAVNVSGLFLEKVPIVSTAGRNKTKKEIEYARSDAPFRDFKIVVLVNEASASASEIVAGALQDHKRAIVVGKPTFGKGSVQTVIDLDNNAGLKLTVARYFTPNGRSIQSKGIIPDIEVDKVDLASARKPDAKMTREEDLEGHILGENERKSDDKFFEMLSQRLIGKDKEDLDKRPIKEKEGKKIRIDDPKELIKTDFQLQQALGYLKAWNIFIEAAKPPKVVEDISKK